MSEEEMIDIIELLKESLSISIEQNTEYGPVEEITVALELRGEIISESSCTLPNQE